MKTKPWTPEDYVRDAEDVAALLRAGLETGELADIRFALRTIARSRGLAKVAEGAGMSRQALHGILDGDADPKLSTVLSLVRTLGLKLNAEPLDTRAA